MPQDSRTPSAFIRRTNLRRTASILCLAAASFGLSEPVNAASYTVLYNFTGRPDGAFANGSLTRDDAGNLYGTTAAGGLYDFGTTFRVDPAGNETTLTNFDYTNVGIVPQPGLVMHKRTLYDTVNGGGDYGAGAVFKNSDGGKAKLLYSFCTLANCADGVFPQYGVTRDNAGNLYGTAQSGGAYGRGVVFKVDTGGHETVLYSFCPNGGTCSDGDYPAASGVIRDSAGNTYGYAQDGPSNISCFGSGYPCGVVWKLDSSGNETVLHAFTGGPSDGAGAIGQLVIDRDGDLYGTTTFGGSGTACGQYGCGTVFKIDTSGNETVLHNFTGSTDGAAPNAEALILDKKGNLYGTATNGGAHGYGTVFQLSESGKFKALYTFQGQSDGGLPLSGLVLNRGALYGEANIGGDLNCSENPGRGCGVVFKITL